MGSVERTTALRYRRRGAGAKVDSSFRTPNAAALHRRCVLMLILPALGLPSIARAGGEEFTRTGDDLVVTVSTRWAGSTHGGYYPIRVQVQNRGVDCTVRFEFTGTQEGVATTKRTLSVAQNATVKFTLPVPCIGQGSRGDLRVYRNGRFVEGLRKSVVIPDPHMGGTPRPALLVISPTDVDFDPFESAVTSTLPEHTSGSGSPGYSGGYYGYATEDHERIEPSLLPEEWIAYSGLDLVAVPLATLCKFTTSERSALLKWVHTGGSLLVYDVGQSAAQSQELTRILEFNKHAATGPGWQPADTTLRRRIRIIDPDASTSSYGGSGFTEESKPENPPESKVDFQWPESSKAFARRELMFGQVYALPDDPFPGTPHDWNWLLSSMPTKGKSWTTRHGITARIGSDEFLEFLIPSVRGVPVIAFLLLITLFTVVIGPLNYIWLWKRRRLYLLVLSIPAIALCTSLALFGYSAIAHGFSTKSRARTVTYVDQTAKSAVTNSRIALYAGLAPSDGLYFSQETAVLPIWPEDHGPSAVTTDWTEQQNLRSGWLKSRTRTQFLTVAHRDERGRLEIVPQGEQLKVTNGFEWGFSSLVVSDGEGRLHYGSGLPAGASAELSLLTSDQQRDFADALGQYPLSPPDLGNRRNGWLEWDMSSFYNYDPSHAVNFNTSPLEQIISAGKNLNRNEDPFPSQAYIGVMTENPGIPLGVKRTRPQASLHVLAGRY